MTPDEYIPFIKGQKRRFRSRAPGEPASEHTVETVSTGSAPGGALTAVFRNTVHSTPERSTTYELKKDAAGVWEGSALVLPLPPDVGSKWDEAERSYEIVSDSETVATPARTFRQCLKVQYLIAGGDGGAGARYYAPGVGLVKEECADEADPFVSELIRLG